MNRIEAEMIGKKVLVRSHAAGVYFGTLKDMEGEQCLMENVRNIWSWYGASCLSTVANDGIVAEKSQVGPVVSSMLLNECCQVIPLSETAIKNLEEQPEWV